MKKITAILTAIAIVSQSTVFAQEVVQGSGAARSSSTAASSDWQNWIYAGVGLIVAAVGVTVVALNTGSNAN